MPQNNILFWLVCVFLEIEVVCSCWCFETMLLGWMCWIVPNNILVGVAKHWVWLGPPEIPSGPCKFSRVLLVRDSSGTYMHA